MNIASALKLKKLTIGVAALFVATSFFLSASGVQAAKDPDEVQMGKEGAAELEKQYKIVEDEAINKRVQTIGQELSKIANSIVVPNIYGSPRKHEFEYTFKILDDKDVNALSMPGGFIYINKGLIDYAQSDDELAGVIAHEIAHVAHHHMLALLKEQSKLNNQLAIALLASVLAGAPAGDIGNVMMGARFIQIAKLNGYSRQAEKDADMAGLAFLSHSKYNPVGMLTFMERLARDQKGRPDINWGVYQTHPYPAERSRDIAGKLTAMGVTIDRREVTNAPKAVVRKSEKGDYYEIVITGKLLYAPAGDDKASQSKANDIAQKLNTYLDNGLGMRDIRLLSDTSAIQVKGETLIQVSDADAALFAPKSAQQLSREAYQLLYRVLFDQHNDKIY